MFCTSLDDQLRAMPEPRYNLAIECSCRVGTVTLGRGDELLDTATLPDPQKPPRRSVDLMPVVDELLQRHEGKPSDLAEVYVSIGPGSFTGLRIAIATVKMFADVLGVRVVALPTLDVVAHGVPVEVVTSLHVDTLAVCLNMKRDTVYAGLYQSGNTGWSRLSEPALTSLPDLLHGVPRPLALLGDPLPDLSMHDAEGVHTLPAEHATPRSDVVWRLGRASAERGTFDEPAKVLPLYVRPPEAVTLWNERHG